MLIEAARVGCIKTNPDLPAINYSLFYILSVFKDEVEGLEISLRNARKISRGSFITHSPISQDSP